MSLVYWLSLHVFPISTAGILMEDALSCFPVLQMAQVRYMTNGPESFTPDNKPLVGRAPEVGEGLCI